MSLRVVYALLIAVSLPPAAAAGAQATDPAPGAETGAMAGMDMSAMDMTAVMKGALGAYPMTQDGSGTSWRPAASPMEGIMWSSGGWTGMAHGYVDLVHDHQGGPRGGDETFSESMVMLAAQHPEGPAR
jgi:hypothetical protein